MVNTIDDQLHPMWAEVVGATAVDPNTDFIDSGG